MRASPTCIALLVLVEGLFSQEEYSIRHLTHEDGLSDNHVYSIQQDSRGYIWIGTRGGINYYDGKKTEELRDSLLSATSSSPVLTASPVPNALWVGSPGYGFFLLDCLSKRARSFDHLLYHPADANALAFNSVTALFQGSDSVLWVGTVSGLGRYDLMTDAVSRISFNDREATKINFITEDSRGVLYAGTEHGLYVLDRAANKLNAILKSHLSDTVLALAEISEDEMWIGACNSGIVRINRRTQDTTRLLMGEDVNVILRHDSGVWVGTATGELYCFKKGAPRSVDYTRGSMRTGITTLFSDRSGALWIGTLGRGVWILNPAEPQGRLYRARAAQNAFEREVWSIAQDFDGRIWVGTGLGLGLLDRSTRTILAVNSFPSGYPVRAIVPHHHTLWTGILDGGVVEWDSRSQRWRRYLQNDTVNGRHVGNLVYSLLIDNKETIWIGSNGGAIAYLDKARGAFKNFGGNAWALCMHEHPPGTLWFGTWSKGLGEFTKADMTLKYLSSDTSGKVVGPADRVLVIHPSESDTNVLWLGTHGAGVIKFDVATRSTSAVTVGTDLQDAVVYGILEDSHNTLWVATHRGIYRFIPELRTATLLTALDGDYAAEYNLGAYCKTDDGELLFGGSHGILGIRAPRDINRMPPQVALTGITSFGAAIDFSTTGNNAVHLPSDMTQLTFEFSALHYKNPGRNTYAHRLVGYDAEWRYTDTVARAYYANITSGDFVFEVKAANSDGIWSEPLRLNIAIASPFWKVWWFYVLATIVLSTAIMLWHRARVKHAVEIERARRLEEERIRSMLKEDVHDTFAGIVAKISATAKDLSAESANTSQGSLIRIAEYADSLLQGYATIQWEYDPNKDSLFDLVAHIKEYGDALFEKSGTRLLLDGDIAQFASIKLPMEWRRELLLLFHEAMNNVAKHAVSSDTVVFSTTYDNGTITMTLHDNGRGFDGERCLHQNGLLHMRERAAKLQGELHVASEPERGTTVCFTGKLNSGRV